MTAAESTRVLDGIEVPAPGQWELDRAHSRLGFMARHLMVTKVRGTFKVFGGEIEVGDRIEDSRVEVRVDAASIDTGSEDRDKHLRSADFLDVEQYPTITFRSTRVEGAAAREGDEFRVVGELSIRGKATEVTLDAEYEGQGQDPWGGRRAGVHAKTEIDRRRWGLQWNQALETGGVLVGTRSRSSWTCRR